MNWQSYVSFFFFLIEQLGQLLNKISGQSIQEHNYVLSQWRGMNLQFQCLEKANFHAEIFIDSLKLLKSGIQWWLKELINLKLIKMYAIFLSGQRRSYFPIDAPKHLEMCLVLLVKTAGLCVIHVHIPVQPCRPLHLCKVCCGSLTSCGNVSALGSD